MIQWLKTVRQYQDEVLCFGLFLTAVGVSSSEFLMSLGSIWVSAWFILTGEFKQKWERLKKSRVYIFLVFYGIHILGMIYSQNWEFGLHDLKIKLPLLSFPIILACWKPIPLKWIKTILLAFVLTVFLMACVVYGRYFFNITDDYQSLMPFISRIRFSICLVFSMVLVFLWVYYDASKKNKAIAAVGFLFLFGNLILLRSITGFVCVWLAAIILVSQLKPSGYVKFFLVVPLFYVGFWVGNYYSAKETINSDQLPAYTANGNAYTHYPEKTLTENGHYIGLYLCEKEMESAWYARTGKSIWEQNPYGYQIITNLSRYITSKGLTKDSVGIAQLSNHDISKILEGESSAYPAPAWPMVNRIYKTLFEIDSYRDGNNPSGHSVTMRLEYTKAGWNVFTENWLLGVGTGDVRDKILAYYKRTNSKLSLKYRKRAHNQWLTLLFSFGIIGFTWIVYALVKPILIHRPQSLFFKVFWWCIVISSLWEDTLETQPGVTLFALLYTLFVYQLPNYQGEEIWRYNSKYFKAIFSAENSVAR